jgi:Skp family chaperone for outer membrane proteins
VRTLLVSTFVLGSVLAASQSTFAQQPAATAGPANFGANAGRFGVAVVDVSFVFKKYPQFTADIEALKVAMTKADEGLKAERDRLVAKEAQRDTLKPGSDQFKVMDEELARDKANFSIQQGTVRRDFLEREAKIYYNTYQRVSEAVAAVAAQNNIGMVLRFNGDPIDPMQREDVMRAIMQPIVFQNNVDITPNVLAALGVNLAPVSSATAPGGNPVR